VLCVALTTHLNVVQRLKEGQSCNSMPHICASAACYWMNFTTVTFTVLAPYNAAPHNRYQPHPAEPGM